MSRYYDVRHANGRLSETILNVAGKPIYGLYVNDNMQLVYVLLPTLGGGKEFKIHVDDEDLSIKPMRLGNVNTTTGVCRLERQPARRWKQGIDLRRCIKRGARVDFFLKHNLESLDKTLVGDFPSFEEALDTAKKLGSCSFTRELHVDIYSNLYYKMKKIGYIKDNVPVLDDKFFFMKEFIEESM